MMKQTKLVVLIGLLLLMAVPTMAQRNKTDEKGRKQGEWIVYYPESSAIRYKGQFKDDKPFGRFEYFFPEGQPMSVMEFIEGTSKSKAILYHRSGNMMGEGLFVDRKKSGLWKFYSESGTLASEETFKAGLKNGRSVVYFPDGKIAEEVSYVDDKREGAWKTYYDNEQIREEASYTNNLIEGKYTKYYKDGKVLATGKYKGSQKDGGWKYFDENGTLDYQELYANGKLTKTKKENGIVETEYQSGKPKAKVEYKGGKLNGQFWEWYDNGTYVREMRPGDRDQNEPDEVVQRLEGQTLKRTGHYKDGNLHGKVTYYNEGGVKTKVEIYENGTLVSTE